MMTTSAPVWSRLEALEKFRQSGLRQWSACCPAHGDRDPSLSIGLGDDGRVLLTCHAGCTLDQIMREIGCEQDDLFPPRRNRGRGMAPTSCARATAQPCSIHARQPAASPIAGGNATMLKRATPQDLTAPGEPEYSQGCTLAQYAQLKALPIKFLLNRFKLEQISYKGAPAVRIPYFAEDGRQILATQYRVALEKAQSGPDARFTWKRGDKATVYGLWQLDEIRQHGEALLVEGASDTHTGWYHDVPTLGVPGASLFSDQRLVPLLEGIETLYVIIEPDRGGEMVRKWLKRSMLRDRVRVIDLAELTGHKDLSALHLTVDGDHDAFIAHWDQAKAAAVHWAELEEQERQRETSAAWSACETLAKQQDILAQFVDELATTGVVGETRNAKLLYLALTSRLLERPVSVIVKGPSSAGKSYTTERVLRYFPESAYYFLTGVSEKALVYSEEPITHRFLIFAEAAGLSSESATYFVRTLLSESRIRYETIEKTPDGTQKARLIEREGPTGVIITTTAVALHPENETRMLSLAVSDTQEQTQAVLLAQAQERRIERDYTRWHALQLWLETTDCSITIPYAQTLAQLIPPIAVRLRRDFPQILNLIRAHALLHQAMRERDADGQIVATLDDYAAVRELVHDLVAEGVDANVSQTIKETVEAVEALVEGGATDTGVTVVAIGQALHLDKSAASRRVQVCMKRGYLKNLEERKGLPGRIVISESLPAKQVILPTVEDLARQSDPVARSHPVVAVTATAQSAEIQEMPWIGCTVVGPSEGTTSRRPASARSAFAADVLALAAANEWRGCEIGPGRRVMGGESTWRTFAHNALLDDLERARTGLTAPEATNH